MVIMDKFSLLEAYLITVGLFLLMSEIGFLLGRWRYRRNPEEQRGPIMGTVVGSLLGLMAFLLAFTIGIVINQQDGRKAMVVMEANAIGTSYLRADFLNDVDRDATRELLKEYTEVRLSATDPAYLERAIVRSEEIHGELWEIVVENLEEGEELDTFALFVESINEVIDVHLLRITAAQKRLPRLFGMMLYAAAMVSFLLMGVVDSSDGKRDSTATVLFALAFVAVLMVVVDLDRPQEGLLSVSQTAMVDLLASMR